jgi:hypothetical protein
MKTFLIALALIAAFVGPASAQVYGLGPERNDTFIEAGWGCDLMMTGRSELYCANQTDAKETCQGTQCHTETCTSDSCADGIDTKACHPTHCHKRLKGD